MKSILTLSLVSALSVILSAPAAVTTSSTGTLNLNVTASAATTGPLNLPGSFSGNATNSLNFTLPQFNAALGTLQSVQFMVTLPTSATAATFDVSGLNLLSTATLNRSLSLTTTAGAFTNPLGTGTANVTGAPLLSALGLTAGLGFNTDATLTGPNAAAVQGFSTSTFSSINQLSAVTGSGNLSFSLSATDLYQFTTTAGTGVTTWGGTTSYAGTVSVIYTYTAVPEPAATALLIAGGLGLFLICRRRPRGE